MATWGKTDPDTGWGTAIVSMNNMRYFGGQFGSADGSLNFLRAYFQNRSGGGLPTAAIYIGGTATDPEGAELLEALGQFPMGTAPNWFQVDSQTNPTIPANSQIWIAIIGASSSNQIREFTADGGDIDGIATDGTIVGANDYAWPEVVPESAGSLAANAYAIYLDFTEESEPQTATVTPDPAALTVFGNAPLVNDFTSIVLRGTLINEAGSPLADLTNLSCLVWYNTAPAGAPDESLSSLTTNSNGSYSFALALGGLAFGEQVYRVIYRNDPPTANNCRVHSPSYE